jgi:GT2 family glycosyltransferase
VANARNYGAEVAQGLGLLFLDDDMVAAPSLVREHALVHLEDPWAVAIGHISVPKSGRRPWVDWEDHHLERHYSNLRSGRRIPGPRDCFSGNISISATLFKVAGGFDPTLPRAEDLEFGYRLRDAGASFYYRAQADSTHLGQHTFEGWARNAGLYGWADVMLAWEKGHTELQKDIFKWYHARRSVSKSLVSMFSAHPGLLNPTLWSLNMVGRAAYTARTRRVSRAIYGTVHHLKYWMGLIDALGRRRFWDGVEAEGTTAGSAPNTGTSVGYDVLST